MEKLTQTGIKPKEVNNEVKRVLECVECEFKAPIDKHEWRFRAWEEHPDTEAILCDNCDN